MPSGTALSRSIAVRDAHFGGVYLPFGLYTREADYFTHQSQYAELTAALQADAHVLPGSVDSWYDAFLSSSWHNYSSVSGAATPAAATAFYAAVRSFLAAPEGARHVVNVRWSDNTENATITATRVPALFAELTSAQAQIDAMASARAVVASADTAFPGALVYTYPMVFWEGLAVLQPELIRNVTVAAACVFVVCWVVLGNLPAASIVLATIAMVDVCLLGAIHWIGEYVNMVTAITLLLAIGLCIDYSAHVCHAFMLAEGTRNQRAQRALEHIGGSVIHGGMTTLLSTGVMLFARSYVFKVISRMFVLLVIFGLFFGMLLLPVLLSLCGPATSSAGDDMHGARGDEATGAVATAATGWG